MINSIVKKKIKAILIDDEPLALEYLERHLLHTGKIEIIGKYTNPLLGEKSVLHEDVDVIFLDIHIPKINGLELAERILMIKPKIIIIFVTAYNEHAVQAFELHALDYLIKPIRKNRLEKTISRLEKYFTITSKTTVSRNSIIRVNLFRHLSIESDSNVKEIPQWRTIKAQQIFLYLLHHRGRHVRKSLFVDLFWEDCEPEKGYSQLYTTIYHIRKTLNKYKYNNYFTISSISDGYMLNVNNITLDIEEWEKTILALPEIDSQSIDEYTKAMNHYKGGYLQDYDYLWAETERHRLERLWIQIAYKIAEWYQRTGDLDTSIEVYHNICNVNPYEESAYLSLMKIYAIEKINQVEEQYNKLKECLMKDLNVEPRDDVVKWYTQWMNNNNNIKSFPKRL